MKVLKSLVIVLLLVAVTKGEVAIVLTNTGAKVIDELGTVATVPSRNVVDLRNSTPTPDPGPDPIPPVPGPTTLDQQVTAWVASVGEPNVATTMAAFYSQWAARLNTGATWAQAKEGIRIARELVLSQATKKEAWKTVFAQIDTATNGAPQTAATLNAIAKGYQNGAKLSALFGGAQPISWIKLISCIPCIISAFTDTQWEVLIQKAKEANPAAWRSLGQMNDPVLDHIDGIIERTYPQLQLKSVVKK